MSVYPEKIRKRLGGEHAGKQGDGNCTGTAAVFTCGTFVRFFLRIEKGQVVSVGYQTSGCGFMAAAAEVLAVEIEGKSLSDLHGLDGDRLETVIENELGEFPAGRSECLFACISAVRAAFVDHRASVLEEFAGETPLICTCFGITEERIEQVINENLADSTERVGELTNAGTGCGSCRMLIQEMIDML